MKYNTGLAYFGLTEAYKIAGYQAIAWTPETKEHFGIQVLLDVDWPYMNNEEGKVVLTSEAEQGISDIKDISDKFATAVGLESFGKMVFVAGGLAAVKVGLREKESTVVQIH